jgi:hypothetical protein
VGSKQAYGQLAEKYCPGVCWNCGPVFWRFCVRLCCHRYRTVEISSFVYRVTQFLNFCSNYNNGCCKSEIRIWTFFPMSKFSLNTNKRTCALHKWPGRGWGIIRRCLTAHFWFRSRTSPYMFCG